MEQIATECEALLKRTIALQPSKLTIPSLTLNLEQLYEHSNSILDSLNLPSTTRTPSTSINAAQFLQSHGVDPQQLERSISNATFCIQKDVLSVKDESFHPSSDILIESQLSADQFIEESNDIALNSILNRSHSSSVDRFKKSVCENQRSKWRERSESLEIYQFSTLSSDYSLKRADPYSSLLLSYANLVRKISMKQPISLGIAESFLEISQSFCKERIYEPVLMLWKYLVVLEKSIDSGAFENSEKCVIESSRTYLERMYFDHVNMTLSQHPRSFRNKSSAVNVDLDPSISVAERICCYAKIVTSSQLTLSNDDKLAIELTGANNEVPFWATLYFLLRCGFRNEAMQWTEKYIPFLERTNSINLVELLKVYSRDSHSDKSLSYSYVKCDDPYKDAVLRLLLNESASFTSDIISKTECYLWYQLSLPTSTLSSVRKHFFALPRDYFGTGRNGALLFSFVMLLLASFSESFDCLMERSEFKVDAIHLGICSMLLLKRFSSSTEMSYNATRLCIGTAKLLNSFDSQLAVHYAVILNLPQSQLTPILASLLAESPNYSSLVGGINNDGILQPGYLSSIPSISLPSICTAAARLLQPTTTNRLVDCVLLYHAGQSYDKVISLLLREGRLSLLHQRTMETSQFLTKFAPLLDFYSRMPSAIQPSSLESFYYIIQMCKLEIYFVKSSFATCIELWRQEFSHGAAIEKILSAVGTCLVEWLLLRVQNCYLTLLVAKPTTLTEDDRVLFKEESRALIQIATGSVLRDRLSSEAFGLLCAMDLKIQ